MTDNDRGKKKIHRGVYPRKIASFLVGNYNRLALVSLAFLYYCCCFLLLSSSVDCFTCLSPFIVRKTIQIHPHIELLKQQRNDCYHCPSRTFLPSSKTTKEQDHGDDSTTSDINNNVETLVTWFIKNLWRGVTIPFPQLKVVVQSHGTKKSGLAIGLGLRKGVLFLFSYLSVGVIAYSYIFEKWSIVDSLYFTTVCFTTVGYGDLVPTSPAGKIFTCFFGIAGITFLGAAVATICSSVVQAEVEAAKKVERVSKRRILNIFGGMPDKLKYFKKSSSKSQKELLEKVEKQKQRKAKLASYGAERAVKVMNTKLLKSYLPSLSVILGGGAIMGKLNHGWSLIDSIYYSIITGTTRQWLYFSL